MQARLYTHQCTIKPSPIEPIREEPDHLPRHHRPRLPLAPAPPPPPPPLISTNTTAPVHINSRSVRSFSPLSLAHHQHQHVVLAHAPQRLVQCPRSRHKSHRLQDRHHWRRGKGHAQRNLPSRIHRRGYRHQKGQFSLIFFITPLPHLVYLGIRHGNAVLFLPLYPLSRRTRKERRPVRHHQPRPQLHLTIPLSSDWDRIKSPDDQIVPYADLPKPKDTSSLKKLAVLKVNGGLGTSMGMFLPCHPCCLSAHVDISQE